jgi:hypothetical protein
MFIEAWSAAGYLTDCIQFSQATLSTLPALNTNKTTTCILPGGGDPQPVLVPDYNAIIVFYSVLVPDPFTGTITGNSAEIRAAYASLSSNLALPSSWTVGNFRMQDSNAVPLSGVPAVGPYYTSDPSVAVVTGKTYPIILDYYYNQLSMYQAYIPLTLDQLYLQVKGGTPLPTLSAQTNATIASNVKDGVIPDNQIPTGVPIWQKYIITKIPTGLQCASANGCWQITNPHNQRTAFQINAIQTATATAIQDVTVDTLPAGSFLTSLRLQTATACSGTGLTAITSTVGTSANDGFFYTVPYDLTSTPGGTNFAPSNGVLNSTGSLTSYGDTLVLGVTTSGGNVSAINGGCQINLWISYTMVQ